MVFESITDGLVIIDSQGYFSQCNSAALSILSLTKEQLFERTPTDLKWKSFRKDGTDYPFEDQPAIVALKTDKKAEDIVVLELPSGERRWIDVKATPFTVQSKSTTTDAPERNVLVVFSNITKHILNEKKTLQTQQLLRASLESPKGMIIMAIDAQYQYLFFNSVHKNAMQFAYDKDVEIGMNILDCITSEEDRKKSKINYDQALAGESHSTIEVYGDDNKAYYESFYNPIRDENQKIIGVSVFARDITDRTKAEAEQKQAEDSSRISEQKYRSLFNSMLEGFALHEIICDSAGKPIDYRFVDMNPAFEKLTGLKKNDVIGKTVKEIMPQIEPSWIEKYGNVALTGAPISFDNLSASLNRHYLVEAFSPKIGQFATIFNDITQLKRSEESLRKSESQLTSALIMGRMGHWELDVEKGIFTFSDSFYAIFHTTAKEVGGYTMSIGDYATRFVHPEDSYQVGEEIRKAIETNDPNFSQYIVHRIFYADGGSGYVAVRFFIIKNKEGKTIRTYGVNQDITDRIKMEEQLQKSQKLESLGLLAGGIAHDFNNLLGGIYGYMDLASDIATDRILHQYISKAMNTIDRGRHLTQQLLTFAKGGVPIKSVSNLFPHLCEITQFSLSGSNISSTFNIASNLHACSFDKNQIAQVIDNIIINAKQAMPDGGKIEISAQNVTFQQGQHASLGQGDYVQVSIRDHGIGMPKEILHRIFDPFYTTKATGHGLGLATSYSIINRHGGHIDVESVPGKGSTFYIYLPASVATPEASEEKSKCQHSGTGTFIVMDDEEVMRETIATMLKSFGYTVFVAKDGQEAIDILESEIIGKRKVTAMILDLTIPGALGGKETIIKIRGISVEIPVFVVSGYAEDPVIANPKEYGFIASLCKPFRKVELAELLNKHLVSPYQ
jgi:PAS domain S-box-containing protein